MEQKQTYIGHERQLQHVADELRLHARDQNPKKRLFLISGPAGLGKRTFLQRLWQRVDPAEGPRILIFEKGERDVGTAESLISGMDANRGFLKKAIEQLQQQYQATLARLEEGSSEGLPPQARLTLLSDLIEQFVVEQAATAKGLQVLMFVGNADAMPPTVRQQLFALIADLPGVDARLFVTSVGKPNPELLGPVTAMLGDPEEIQLPAFTPEDVEVWLRMHGHPDGIAAEVYQAASGLPGKLPSAAQQILATNKARAELAIAEHLLGALAFDQRLAVCAAAYLPELSDDSLKCLFSAEQSTSLMQLIRRLPLGSGTSRSGPVKLEGDAQTALRCWLEHHRPEHALKARKAAAQFAEISARIPNREHRIMLSRLTGFNYLNQEVLEEVFGKEAAGYHDFLSQNHGYFEVNGTNYRLIPEVRGAIDTYCKLNELKRPEDESARIAAAWEKRRQDVLRSSALAEERVKEQNEALDKLLAQIRKLKREIHMENEAILKLRRKYAPAASSSHEPKRSKGSLGSIALQVIGTGVLYFSILLSEKVSLTYAALGVVCILAGLFLHGRRSLVQEPATKAQVAVVDTSKQERNLHFLELKRKQLEIKHSLIAMNLAKQRSALKEFDRILREPYS